MDGKENKFVQKGVVCSVAVQAACRLSVQELTYLAHPARGSRGSFICDEEKPWIILHQTALQAEYLCMKKRHHRTCSPQYVNVGTTNSCLLEFGISMNVLDTLVFMLRV